LKKKTPKKKGEPTKLGELVSKGEEKLEKTPSCLGGEPKTSPSGGTQIPWKHLLCLTRKFNSGWHKTQNQKKKKKTN